MEEAVAWLIRFAGVYLLTGLLFALYFINVGAGRIDPSARDATWGFKLLILPGAAVLWPLLLTRVIRHQSEPPVECNAHRRSSGVS
jgi:hypothetical protein